MSTLNLLRVDSDFRPPASALRWQGRLSEERERGAVSAPSESLPERAERKQTFGYGQAGR